VNHDTQLGNDSVLCHRLRVLLIYSLYHLRRYATNNRVGSHIFGNNSISSHNRIFADGHAWHNGHANPNPGIPFNQDRRTKT
jgi:hypothetical protein